ncbi:MAG: DUF1178 family protein [Pseudomonadota bacterium]|nr:DUF1178 family protein [Pseudomonadota bacterium]
MIRYMLQCEQGHEFEAWFRNSSAYDRQAASRQIACPHYGSTHVSKAVMAPNIAPKASSADEAKLRKDALEAVRALRDKVKADSEYVGDRFANEARKIHHEEAPQRGIYGEATSDEVKELSEDGIEVHPLPVLPEDTN